MPREHDNNRGVYILETRCHGGITFRVGVSENIRSLKDNPDYPEQAPRVNRQALGEIFGGSPEYRGRTNAKSEAQAKLHVIQEAGDHCKHGIQWLKDFRDINYPRGVGERRGRSRKMFTTRPMLQAA